jgi:nucleoside-diphosphate-sugar epimerase
MRVFVTGAAGFIGSAVVKELMGAGHSVLGLARSDANVTKLQAAGADVHRGSLEDLDSLKSGAKKADGVIHLAFNHDFSKFAENGAVEGRAIEAMGDVLAGSNRPLVVTSGTAMIAPGHVATEDIKMTGDLPRKSEWAADQVKAKGVRTMAIRLAPCVHGHDSQGFASVLIQTARDKRVSTYVGDGANRWTAVHRLDAARLYRLALEKGTAGGIYHGIGDEGIAVKDLATAIGKGLNVPVKSITPDEAPAHFGFIGMFIGADIPASSAKTQKELGWHPTHPGLLAALAEGSYFKS